MNTIRAVTTTMAALCLGAAAAAQEPVEDAGIAPQPLNRALEEFANRSGLQVIYVAELAEGKETAGAEPQLSDAETLDQLLASTGLEYEFLNGRTVTVQAIADEAEDPGNAQTTPRPVVMPQASETSREQPIEDLEVHDEQQNPDLEQRSRKLEEIVVVGSRLGSTLVDSALPVKLLTREEIDRSGASTIAEALSLLPEVSLSNNGNGLASSSPSSFGGSTNSSTVQLRGLPLGTTLVLVNGRRVGNSSAFASLDSQSFFDLTNLPLSMVERIEVLPYGASAAYGGDGLAGVVNIVLKRDAKGLEVRFRNGAASGFGETQASLTWGQAWSRGSLTATLNYEKNGTLTSSERALTRDRDFRRFGGRDWRSADASNIGTVYSLEGCPPPPDGCFTVPVGQRGNLPGLNAPVAGIPAGQDGERLTPGDFEATAGVPNLGSSDVRFFSASEVTNIMIEGRYEIGTGLELFGDVLYTRRDVPPDEMFVRMSGGQFGFTTVRVPAENPFNPFGVDVGVDVRQESTGIFSEYRPEYFQPTLGIRGGWADWSWELVGSLSKDLTDAVLLTQDGDAVVAALNSTDPAAALNVFRGDGGSFGSQALIESLFIRSPREFHSELWQVTGSVRGSLSELPGGPIETFMGLEWARQELQYRGNFTDPDNPDASGNAFGRDDSRAAFGEVRVPLLARSNGSTSEVQRALLALTAGFRADVSDRFEETGTTETVGLEVRPSSSVLFRASHSSAFKPLSTFGAFGAERVFSGTRVVDPNFGGETFFVESRFSGGVPQGLKPETSTSRTAGLVWTPRAIDGLNLTVTAWESKLRDRLAQVGTQFIVDNEESLPGRVVRDPQTGVITEVDNRSINIARTDVEGVDLGLSMRWSTRYGEFNPSVEATWTGRYDEQITPDGPLEDRVGVLNFVTSAWSPDWKAVTALKWMYADDLKATLIGRYIAEYEDSRALETGPAAGTFQKLGDFWTFDLNFDLAIGRWLVSESSWLSTARLNIGGVNLFDQLPEFCAACASRGYDATQYDVRGRFVYAGVALSL